MPDVFSNLAAQSLNRGVGIQPLIPPLFAPAPQLNLDTTLLAFNDQPGVSAENASFSITPAIFADGKSDNPNMEQPSVKAASPEKRNILPNLVPPDFPKHAISILSLRHLLHPKRLTSERMEPVLPTSQPSTTAPTVDETSSEDAHFLVLPQDDPVVAALSRTSPIKRPPFIAFQPVQAQEATSPGAVPENTVMWPSLTHTDDWRQTGENLLDSASTKHEPQHSLLKDHLAIPTEEAPYRNADESGQPVSPQPFVQSELNVNRDDILVEARFIEPTADVPTSKPMQQTTTGRQQPEVPSLPQHRIDQLLVKPLLDRPARSVSGDEGGEEWQGGLLWSPTVSPNPSHAVQSVGARFIAPPAVVPAQNVLPTMMLHASQEMPNAAAGSQRRDVSAASGASINSPAPTADVSAFHPATASDTPHSPQVSPKHQTVIAQDEAEQPPIRVTIGRVVVRATSAIQPRPTQKRVLRPSKSLGDYLKQRERGSR